MTADRDAEIVEAMARAIGDVAAISPSGQPGSMTTAREVISASLIDAFAKAALSAARPLIEAQARAEALEEAKRELDREAKYVDGKNADRYWQTIRLIRTLSDLAARPAEPAA